ncbi:ATP-binding cassette domain-containing protein [Coraliomargarita algicola]|uniref:ATP-binding cassette domain-containing protein n=1 Tax=Coraliomargarita algicola TaxID=3092156 RepID=A0ABZ0RF59_9BACT|nr:ATP-binding cassette domain-containing protein [Coraliomargarita sp. J2-16]WPJ94036.1 ATP-binding cassette domain-containing protein [Coraliomargarita sp. J2-16]
MNSSVPALMIRELSIFFEGRPLLSDFSLELRAGEKVALAGRSGAGKTTLLRALMGFCVPAAGSLSVAGLAVDAANVAAVRQCINWLPQQAEPGADTVREALCLPLEFKRNQALAARFTDVKLHEVLQAVGLAALDLAADARRLSGGEQQRLALARALLLDRPVWLVDEPTSSLDAETKTAVMDCILASPERTVLAISHDAEFLARFNRVVRVGEDGQHG